LTWLPAGYCCPMGSSAGSIRATRRPLTQRPCAVLAAGRYGRHWVCSAAMPESTATRVEKRRGDRQHRQPCNASPRLGPSSRGNSRTTVNADVTVVARHRFDDHVSRAADLLDSSSRCHSSVATTLKPGMVAGCRQPVSRDVILLSVGVVVAAEAQAAAGDLAG
jgi:hypothetical protein